MIIRGKLYKRKMLGRSKYVASCSSINFLANGDDLLLIRRSTLSSLNNMSQNSVLEPTLFLIMRINVGHIDLG